MLTLHMLIALLPLLVVCTTVVVVMLAIAVARSHFWSAFLTILGLILALFSIIAASEVGPQFVTELIIVDRISWFHTAIILVSALVATLLNHSYLESQQVNRDEMYLLLLMATTGAIVLVCSRHVATFFLGLETLSVALYGMTAYIFTSKRALEAGVKYLILSSAASAFLMFGLALLYAQTGTLSFAGLGAQLTADVRDPIVLTGLAMILAAIAFKLSLAPFHQWVPDVYEGASAPAGAFIASGAKVAVFVGLWRMVMSIPLLQAPPMLNIFIGLAIASILIGNLLALTQSNIKRLLGYSSIAHFGYLFIALTVAQVPLVHEAIGIYLLTYVLATLVAFGAITMVSSIYPEQDADDLDRYRGLFWQYPYLAVVITISMLSLAGIPLTAGFIGKFYIVALGVSSQSWLQLGALVIGSGIGIFYYLRVIFALYTKPRTHTYQLPVHWSYSVGGAALMLVAVSVLVLGIYPQPVLAWLQG